MSRIDKPFTIYSDGGSRGNPGPAAFSYVMYDPEGNLVAEKAVYIGIATNNQAEYQGIAAALEAAHNLRIAGPIVCKLDSQLVVRQINGVYRMKNDLLRPWLEKIHHLKSQLDMPIEFVDIPREENKQADKLVNVALDGVESDSHYESKTVPSS